MSIDSSLTISPLEYRIYANGSGVESAKRLEQELGEIWWALNAEKILDQKEPAVGAREAVLDFKLKVGEIIYQQLADNPEFSGAVLRLMATDVTFFNPDGLETHQLARGEFDRKEEVDRLAELFSLKEGQSEVDVSWVLVVGLISWFLDQDGQPISSQKKIVELEIRASFTKPPTREEIDETFNPHFSPGFDVVNLATPDRSSLTLKSSGDDIEHVIDQELARMLVEKKIPPQVIYQALLMEEGEIIERESGEDYQLISVSLLGLAQI